MTGPMTYGDGDILVTSGVKRKGDPKGDMIRKGNGIEGEKFQKMLRLVTI